MHQTPALSRLPDILEELNETTIPLWGTMNAAQMCRHCTSFIRLSLGEKNTSTATRIIGKLFGKYMYRYFSKRNPWSFPKNLQTLPEIKQRNDRVLDFELEKEQLTATIQKAAQAHGTVRHPLYGKMDAEAVQNLIAMHTTYHFRQFGLIA
jgi:hypothetical protein